MEKLLYVEPHASTRRVITDLLCHENYEVIALKNGEEGLSVLNHENFDAILYSTNVSDIDCLSFLEKIRSVSVNPSMILLEREELDSETRANCQTNGIEKIINKTNNLQDILDSVRNVIKNKATAKIDYNNNINKIIGHSQHILDIKELINKVSHYDLRVLITGENGTGKDVVASNIHANSLRRNQPMCSVNCATLNNDLADSILFGHEKGAFTGAINQRIGYFERASGGTLFLDEVGELSMSIQTKLLRALETRKITRLGSTKEISIDTRIIAATNRNLAQAIDDGSFREDLYYRLNSIEIHLPPLRERCEDIPEFINEFLSVKNHELGISKQITESAIDKLTKMNWRGNVRELNNAIEKLLIFSDSETITVTDIDKYCKTSR